MTKGPKNKERSFYIKVSNLYIEHGKSLYFGPFKNKGEAQTEIDAARNGGIKLQEGDEFVDDQTLNVTIIGGTQAKRDGMKEPIGNMPNIEKWEGYFAGGDIFRSNRGRPPGHPIDPEEDNESLEVVTFNSTEDKISIVAAPTPSQPQKPPSNVARTTESVEYVIAVDDSHIVAWLHQKGFDGSIIPVIQHESQLAGKVVIGNIPPSFMWAAKYFGIINIPNKRKEDILSPEEIDRRGGRIDWYYTRKGKGEQHK